MYERFNRRFMQHYQPLRELQRRGYMPASAVAGIAAGYGINYIRNKYRQFQGFRRSYYGKAVAGAISSLKKKDNMAVITRKRKRTPISPKSAKSSRTRQTAMKRVKSKGKTYAVKKTYKGGHQLLDAIPFAEKKVASTGGGPNTNYVVAAKKVNKKAQSKYARLGFEYKIERSGSVLRPESVYVGHSSIPRNWAATMMFSAILKKLFQRIGCLTSDPTKNMPFVANGDQLQLVYKVRVTDGEITQNATFLAMGGTSLRATVDYWAGWIANTEHNTETEFVALQYIPEPDSVLSFHRVNLRSSKLKINSLSVMSIQNTSVGASANPSVDSLDATSLRGYVYEGKGTGTIYAADGVAYTVPFYPDGYGVINADSTVANSLKEPPQAFLFNDVKRYNNILYSPGEIKRSVLRDNFTITINKMVRHIVADLTPQSGYFPFLLGKFKFMGLERMVDFPGEGDPVSLNWDHQLNLGSYLIGGFEDITCPYVIDA